ncbi:MAG: thioesterase family protein [Alphaproteobacteria bacterium]|nr:thioesterase family protein [Alphaproteobacteria bacterium]
MSPRTFPDAVALAELGDGRYSTVLDPSWAQGRAAFGGLVAGWAVAALRRQVDATLPPGDVRPLRSVMVDFVAPVAPGPVEVRAEVLRSGSSLTQGRAEVLQDGQVAAVLLAAFGAARPTRIPWAPAPQPPLPEDRVTFPYIEGVLPAFVQHYSFEWARTNFPYTGADSTGVDGRVRPATPAPVDEPALMGIIDAWPAPVLCLSDRPIPSSTVTWFVNVVTPPPVGGWPGDGWFRYQSDCVVSADGHVDMDSRLWGPDGSLVATSRQLVVEFSGRTR